MTRAEAAKLDKLVSAKVHERGGWCDYCRKPADQYHVHHIVTRSNRTLRWDPDNLVRICRGCHLKAHTDAFYAVTKAQDHLGKSGLDRLLRRGQAVKQVTDYEAVRLMWETF